MADWSEVTAITTSWTGATVSSSSWDDVAEPTTTHYEWGRHTLGKQFGTNTARVYGRILLGDHVRIGGMANMTTVHAEVAGPTTDYSEVAGATSTWVEPVMPTTTFTEQTPPTTSWK